MTSPNFLFQHIAYAPMPHRRAVIKDLINRILFERPDETARTRLNSLGWPNTPNLPVIAVRGRKHGSEYYRCLHAIDRVQVWRTWGIHRMNGYTRANDMELIVLLDDIERMRISRIRDTFFVSGDQSGAEANLDNTDDWPFEPGLGRMYQP
jgi:hypothetical protein